MNGLLEFLFEGISPKHLAAMVLEYVCEEKNVSGASQDGVDLPIQFVLDPAFWINLASLDQDTTCTVNLRTLRFGGKSVDRATLQIIHYNNTNDVSVLLSSEDCRQANIVAAEEIYQWAKANSETYGVDNFCGGLDSASDEDTQMYSKSGVSAIASL